MRILMIRHGDPDYEHDTLTPTGHREAALLAERMAAEEIRDFYVSPMGRARDTAGYTLRKMNREAEVLDWLMEFDASVEVDRSEKLRNMFPEEREDEEGRIRRSRPWDILPEQWMHREEFFTRDGWRQTEFGSCSSMIRQYDMVTASFDALLKRYGYERNGSLYTTRMGNTDTIALFCHFGVTCVMLSHLWNVSPFILWHSLCAAPTSVTEVYTEEREKGIVSMRASKFGDVSHLYAGGQEPSFAARFCETFESPQRH